MIEITKVLVLVLTILVPLTLLKNFSKERIRTRLQEAYKRWDRRLRVAVENRDVVYLLRIDREFYQEVDKIRIPSHTTLSHIHSPQKDHPALISHTE